MALNRGLINVIEFINKKTGEQTNPSEIIENWRPVGIGYQQNTMRYGRALILEHPKTGLKIDVSLSIVPKGYLPGRAVGFCIESDAEGEYYTGTARVSYEVAGNIKNGLQMVDEKSLTEPTTT